MPIRHLTGRICLLLLLLLPAALPAKDLRVGLLRHLTALDPIYTTTFENIEFIGNLFDSLLLMRSNGTIIPGLAESWDLSEDKMTYRFHLRDGLTWSDGAKLTAEDVVLGFQRLVDPGLTRRPKPTYLLEQVVNAQAIIAGQMPVTELGITAPDPHTVEIRLTAPSGYFLAALAYPGLTAAPTHLISRHGNDWYMKFPYVSNGPYVLRHAEAGTYVIERRPGYWTDARMDRVIMRFFDTPDEMLRELLSRKLDIAGELGLKHAQWIDRHHGYSVRDIPLAGTIYGAFNTLLPRFADPEIRRALSMLVERDLIAEPVGHIGARSFTPPQLLHDPHLASRGTDTLPRAERLQTAREILHRAGYSAETPLKVTIMLVGKLDFDRICNGIIASWSIPEIAPRIEAIERKSHSPRMETNRYEFVIASWFADYPDPMTFLALLRPRGPKNHADWVSPAYAALLDRALVTPERADRQDLYEQMEELIRTDNPIIPLTHPVWTVVADDRISEFGGSQSMIQARTVEMK